MFFITNAKYTMLINSLTLDLPFRFNEEREYFWGSKMTSFDLDLNYFTKSEARALIISDLLFQDTKNALATMHIRKQEQAQDKWIFPLSEPKYHITPHCEYLKNDFSNIRIPNSLAPERIVEYRTYFLENYRSYGRKDGQKDPRIFFRALINTFNLLETVEEMDNSYFSHENLENSGMTEFNITLDFDKETNEINTLINIFKGLVKSKGKEFSRTAYLYKKSENMDETEREQRKEIFEKRKALVARILNFHFRKLFKDGLNLPQTVLELVGLTPCQHCCRGK